MARAKLSDKQLVIDLSAADLKRIRNAAYEMLVNGLQEEIYDVVHLTTAQLNKLLPKAKVQSIIDENLDDILNGIATYISKYNDFDDVLYNEVDLFRLLKTDIDKFEATYKDKLQQFKAKEDEIEHDRRLNQLEMLAHELGYELVKPTKKARK